MQAQNGCIGSSVAAPAGAKLADGSAPQHAGQAGNSTGGKNNMLSRLNHPQLDANELCTLVDPETGMACVKKRNWTSKNGKRYFSSYCCAGRHVSGNNCKRKAYHDFRREPDKPWP